MASNGEYLPSSPAKRTSIPCEALFITLSVTTIISFASFIAIQFSTTNTVASLCTNSPRPSVCHAIISDVLSHSNPKHSPLHIFKSLVVKSLHQIKSAELETSQLINSLNEQLALTDCTQLMDMSHDRLIHSIVAVANGTHTDARTWISAVLANHATCLDGLTRPTRSVLESILEVLIDFANAKLAVLNAVDSSSNQQNKAIRTILDFPAWMSFHDRKLLEAFVGDRSIANVVIAEDGSGNYKTVQEAVNSAPNKGKSRYVIYVKEGDKENVSIGKKKTYCYDCWRWDGCYCHYWKS